MLFRSTQKKPLYRNTPAYAILIKKEKKRKAIYISIPRNTKEIIPRNKEGVENQPFHRGVRHKDTNEV